MQMSIQATTATVPTAPLTRAGDKVAAPIEPSQPPVRKGIDFSHVTPRQLLAYVNEEQSLGTIDPLEGGALVDQVPTGDWETALDVPFDLHARLSGTRDFHLDRGDPLASWYTGLIKRLDALEAQSMRVSAFA
jgi:hypothetical protein